MPKSNLNKVPWRSKVKVSLTKVKTVKRKGMWMQVYPAEMDAGLGWSEAEMDKRLPGRFHYFGALSITPGCQIASPGSSSSSLSALIACG
jgi:hypothetical protein